MSLLVPPPGETDPARLVRAIRDLAEGRSNAVGSAVLTPGVAATTVRAVTCAPGSVVLLTPQSASAAAAVCHVAAASGSFTIHHDISPAADRRFGFAVLG